MILHFRVYIMPSTAAFTLPLSATMPRIRRPISYYTTRNMSSSSSSTYAPASSTSTAVQLADSAVHSVNIKQHEWIDSHLRPHTEVYRLCRTFAENVGRAKRSTEWCTLAGIHVQNTSSSSKVYRLADMLHTSKAPYQLYALEGSRPMAVFMTNHSKPTNIKIESTRAERLYGEKDDDDSEGSDGSDDEEDRKPLQQRKIARPTALKSGRPSPHPSMSPSSSPTPVPLTRAASWNKTRLSEWDETKVSTEIYSAFPFLHENAAFKEHLLSQRITGADMCMTTINNADKMGVLLGLDEIDAFKGSKYNILCERIWSRVQQWK